MTEEETSYPGDLSERQQHLIDNPDASIVTAINSLFNAMRLVRAFHRGEISPDVFSSDFTLENAEGGDDAIQICAASNPLPADLLAENIMMNVAATCFMQLDELARQKLHGRARFADPDEDVRNATTILFLVRCAFAHNPLIPTWLIDSRFRDQIYTINDIGIRLDTTDLHRKTGVIPRIGGWVGALRLMKHAHRLVSPETAASMDLQGT